MFRSRNYELNQDNDAGNSFATDAVRMLLLEYIRLDLPVGLPGRCKSARSLPIQNKCRRAWGHSRRKRLLHKRDLERRA